VTKFDTIIIGAGPAGSVAAIRLARAGRAVALVEKAEFPRRKVCGEFISAPTLALLEDCGVADAFMKLAGPNITKVGFYAGAAMIEAPLPSGGGRALGREHLDTLLRDAAVAAGATLFQPAEVTALTRGADGFVCQLEDQSLSAPLVIAASGSWSAKGPFAIAAPARASDLFGFKAHFTNARLPQGLMPLLAFAGGYGGMVESDGGRISLSCCIRRDTLGRLRASRSGRAADAVLAHIQENSIGAARALDGAMLDGAFLSAGPIRPGIRAKYRNRIFFTGNLAGEAHPVIAEGISMAIQSSSLLAEMILQTPDPDAAGARYARAWHRRFALRIRASQALAHLAMTAPGRGAMAALTARLPALLTFGARIAGKAE
jgi:flavin-dependent dehydrogenase